MDEPAEDRLGDDQSCACAEDDGEDGTEKPLAQLGDVLQQGKLGVVHRQVARRGGAAQSVFPSVLLSLSVSPSLPLSPCTGTVADTLAQLPRPSIGRCGLVP